MLVDVSCQLMSNEPSTAKQTELLMTKEFLYLELSTVVVTKAAK